MKLSVVSLLVAPSCISAFTPNASVRVASHTSLQMAHETDRSDFLRQLSFSAAGALAFAGSSQPASAAKYGGFGAGSPEVLDPKAAIIDRDILGSESIQKSITEVKGYLSSVKSMEATLASDPQADIGPAIRKELDFSKIRDTLNAFNAAIDEDSQRGTDRIIRIILQDVTELEQANRVKAGVARSERKLSTMTGKLNKLAKAFEDYLAFV